MATKKFIIEVEEGKTECGKCPYNMLTEGCRFNKVNQYKQTGFDCNKYNLATMKIKEYDDINEGKALLYAVEKTTERTKREMIEKAVEWMKNNLHNFATNVSYKSLFDKFKKAMCDERDF